MPMHAEPELEALLKRLVPRCDEQWIGATDDEIEELEVQTDVELPAFYRWFLERMGRSMGPVGTSRRDLSVETVLLAYRHGAVPTGKSLLFIGREPDPVVPIHLYCDVSKPARADAMVRSFDPEGGFIKNDFETLREMIGWSVFLRFRMYRFVQRCVGTLRGERGNILAQLEPVLTALGFVKTLPSGTFLGIYERADAGITCSLTPDETAVPYMFFRFGADDEALIRSILGTINLEAGLEVEVEEWIPPLQR